ncbi:hypothetical protein Tco_1204032 [Tanacetum coccineum]
MPYLKFTKLIINHFLSQHKSLAKLKHLFNNTIKDDGVLNRLKFIRMGEYFQEYGRAIPDTIGKGSKGKKQAVIPKKKRLISADDNIIPEPDVAFELGKSMSLTEVDEEEAARRVHATHEHLVLEFDELSNKPTNRPTGRRRPSEQLAVDMKKAIKASKEALRLLQQTGDSSEGFGITLDVPDELTGKFTTSSEGADDSHQSDDEYVDEGEITTLFTDEEEKANEDDDEEDDDKRIDRAETEDKRTLSENDDQEMTDVEKIVGEKLEEEKGDEEEEQADDDQA